MAVYRMEAKIVGRSQGQSACAAAAYRAGCEIEDHRTGQLHDYTRKRGIEHEEIMAPENAPDWAQDRAQLWNAVEERENRSNSQLARELLLSLPHELDAEQRRELVREYVRQEYVEKQQLAADIAIHEAHRQGDERNRHAHVLLTLRRIEADGWAKNKERLYDRNAERRKEQMIAERQLWADHQNRALERAGIEARVDHRSLAARDLDREPEPKLGPVASKMEREGRQSNAGDDLRAVKERNRERARLEEERKVIDLEIEREKRRLAQEVADQKREAARQAEDRRREQAWDDGYAKGAPPPGNDNQEPQERERPGVASDGYARGQQRAEALRPEPERPDFEEIARQQQEDALRERVSALEGQLEGKGRASLLWNKVLGRIAWDAEEQLEAQRAELTAMEQARQAEAQAREQAAQRAAQEQVQQREQDAARERQSAVIDAERQRQAREERAPPRVSQETVTPVSGHVGPTVPDTPEPVQASRSPEDEHPERLTIAAGDAFHQAKQGRAPAPSEAGDAAQADAEEAAKEAKREQYREMFRAARENSRDGPEWER